MILAAAIAAIDIRLRAVELSFETFGVTASLPVSVKDLFAITAGVTIHYPRPP